MWMKRAAVVSVLAAFLALNHLAHGSGLLPNSSHQVTICGKFSETEPAFVLIFSAKPLVGADHRPQRTIARDDLARLRASAERVAIRVYGKKATHPGQFDYCFGPGQDGDRPWNNGEDFRWQDWAQFSPDVWDCVAVCAAPGRNDAAESACVVRDVMIKRNGQLLYDSRIKKSHARGTPIAVSFKPTSLCAKGSVYPLLNLAKPMARFLNDYYELQGNPVLSLAFGDLGQSGFRKYSGTEAKDTQKWCSEFVASVYRRCGIPAPDPNGRELGSRNIRRFCWQSGNVYAAREVASWDDAQKRRWIPPGSFVSLMNASGTTHSLLFMHWIEEPGKPIAAFFAVSGNLYRMVRVSKTPMAPMPGDMDFAKMTSSELAKHDIKMTLPMPGDLQLDLWSREDLAVYDSRVCFGVPDQLFDFARLGRESAEVHRAGADVSSDDRLPISASLQRERLGN
jgi:hypothetical protein